MIRAVVFDVGGVLCASPPGEFAKGGAVRDDMVALVHELKAAGYRTGIMSNIFAERREWLHAFCGDGAIDVFCDSSEVGMRKQEVACYGMPVAMRSGRRVHISRGT